MEQAQLQDQEQMEEHPEHEVDHQIQEVEGDEAQAHDEQIEIDHDGQDDQVNMEEEEEVDGEQQE